MKKLAIITPNYNRPQLLKRLYKSLKEQTCKDFIWYIIDDGSKDDPQEVVDSFVKEEQVEIVFKKKANGGKHTCINFALQLIESPYVVIVDNDDKLTPNAVETILKDFDEIKDNNKICGIGYLKAKFDGNVIGKEYTKDGIVDNFVNQRYNKNTYGDKCEVFKTEILEKYPFPVFEGENFVSESTIWCKMSLDYDMKFFNKAIYLCEYQEGGLSDNVHKRLFNNPKGASACYHSMTSKQFNLKYKIKYTVAYIVYSLASGEKRHNIVKSSNCKGLSRLLFLPSKMIYNKKRKLYRGV